MGLMEGRNRIARRSLLKGMAAGAVLSAGGGLYPAARASDAAAAAAAPEEKPKLRGVNLGSWLVLEKWITPSVFDGSSAPDEFSLCQELGEKAATARLRAHQDAFITDADFQWLAAHGISAVRVPVGYWVLGGEKPFIGSAQTLDRAFQQAGKYGIGVLLDLHGAPGSQNGWDHSGRSGTLGWHTSKENIARTLDFVERLSERYADRSNLIGVELLNEPRWDVPLEVLKSYYQEGYARVRKHIPASRGAVVIHDGFRPTAWKDFMRGPEFENVILDTHIYQCYTAEDHKRQVGEHIAIAADRRKQIDSRAADELPVIVGEWSSALGPESYAGLTGFERETGKRGYVAAQITSYERSRGWFYWTYKLEKPSDWSFREGVERGWLPRGFAEKGERA